MTRPEDDALDRLAEVVTDWTRDNREWKVSPRQAGEDIASVRDELERLRSTHDWHAAQWEAAEKARVAAEAEVERLERDNASLVLARNAAEHARKGDNKFLLERAEAAEAEVRRLTEENQRTRDDWAALRSELNDRDAQLDDELEGRQLSEQAVKTLGAEVRRLEQRLEYAHEQVRRLTELVDEARPYMEKANSNAGPIDDWLALADSPPEAS